MLFVQFEMLFISAWVVHAPGCTEHVADLTQCGACPHGIENRIQELGVGSAGCFLHRPERSLDVPGVPLVPELSESFPLGISER